jgi:hypothetical protein
MRLLPSLVPLNYIARAVEVMNRSCKSIFRAVHGLTHLVNYSGTPKKMNIGFWKRNYRSRIHIKGNRLLSYLPTHDLV